MVPVQITTRLQPTSHSLHFINTSSSSNLSDMRALLGRMISPLCENTRSTGAELAGSLAHTTFFQTTVSAQHIVLLQTQPQMWFPRR